MLPKSLHVRWIKPFVPPPRTPLSSWPRMYCPFFISKTRLDLPMSSFPSMNALVLYFSDNGGMIWDSKSKLDMTPPFANNSASFTRLNIMSMFMASRGVKFTFSLVKR